MVEAPFMSTFIAIASIPVAFLFIHSYLGGLKGWKYHIPSGLIAIIWDLTLSFIYMVYRAIGGQIEGSSLDMTGILLAYFIIHGLVSLIVIFLEFGVIATGFLQWKRKTKGIWHKKLSKILFILWWFAFLSGELFYIAIYII